MENPKHLKRHKTPEINKDTKSEEENLIDQKEKVPTAETRAEEDQKEFNLRLADLKMAVAEMEKHNKDSMSGPKEEITEEIFENIMKMPVSEFMEYANGGKILINRILEAFITKFPVLLMENLTKSIRAAVLDK